MSWLPLRRLTMSAYRVLSRCHDLGNASEPLFSLVDQARRTFSRLMRVTQKSFHVVAQQLALQCGEILRRAALQSASMRSKPRSMRARAISAHSSLRRCVISLNIMPDCTMASTLCEDFCADLGGRRIIRSE